MGGDKQATSRRDIPYLGLMKLADVCSCMRLLHPDLEHRVKNETLKVYKKHLDPFLNYLGNRWELLHIEPEDIDMLVMEFRTEHELTRSQHTQLLAALEFYLPPVKGKLLYTREAIKGRLCHDPVAHTVPLAPEVAFLFGAYHASQCRQRLAAAIFVQIATGLRPSELLGLCKNHVHVPRSFEEFINIRWGAQVSTKIKREQFVQVDFRQHPLAYKLLKLLVSATNDGHTLFPFSYASYNQSFATAEKHFGLELGLTAHSGRAGFATSMIISGKDAKQVQSAGRWLSETSVRTYVDTAGSLHACTQIKLNNLMEAITGAGII